VSHSANKQNGGWTTSNVVSANQLPATLELWKGCLEKWINPDIGDLPLSDVNNSALKVLVAKMSDGGLSPKTITGNYVPVVKMVVASVVDKQGEQIYPRKWNHDFIDLPVPQKDKQNNSEARSKFCWFRNGCPREIRFRFAGVGQSPNTINPGFKPRQQGLRSLGREKIALRIALNSV